MAGSDPNALTSAYAAALPQFCGSGLSTSPLANAALTTAAAAAAGKQIEGKFIKINSNRTNELTHYVRAAARLYLL